MSAQLPPSSPFRAGLPSCCLRAGAAAPAAGFRFRYPCRDFDAGLPEAAARPAAAAVLREFDRLHRRYHAWQPSELSGLNQALAAGRTASVTPEMAGLLAHAQPFLAAQRRAFRPRDRRLDRAVGFSVRRFAGELAGRRYAAAGERRQRVSLTCNSTSSRSVAATPGWRFDFRGYLKGVALDRAASILKAQGVHQCIDQYWRQCAGARQQEWRALAGGYPAPAASRVRWRRSNSTMARRLALLGDYQRYFEIDGRRYCHLLDPRSAEPVRHTQARPYWSADVPTLERSPTSPPSRCSLPAPTGRVWRVGCSCSRFSGSMPKAGCRSVARCTLASITSAASRRRSKSCHEPFTDPVESAQGRGIA
ncbi:FAD:protein FMN transferase [Candidatus Accumulibacter sp. ACC007]|uniref:FAD:protein FMN transferase n=1 Tax=Candidatus Accumulibacter sp. ACC007 TaxID=2823333 RepID=UPI0034269A5F